MSTSNFGYSDPVARLLRIGDPRDIRRELDWRGGSGWADYLADFKLGSVHIPELVRMATDENLHLAMSDTTEVWAPLHAWRALGQLKAVEAIQPLIGLFHRVDDADDDWISDDLPEVMGMIGPAAIQLLAEYLASPKNSLWARVTATASLEKIGARHPDARQASIAALTATLERYAQNDELLNGEIVGSLASLDAVEAAPLVEQAYKADRVDESILGDWEDFQVEVGLLEEPLPTDEDELDFSPFPLSSYAGPSEPLSEKDKKKEKNKRKQAKESRKKNRKKKK